jgi:hypothetical protein
MNSTLKAESTQTVTIELLALDLKTCTRCVGSLTNIQQAIGIALPLLIPAVAVEMLSSFTIYTNQPTSSSGEPKVHDNITLCSRKRSGERLWY